MISYIIVNITYNYRLRKVYIAMYRNYITCYVANLDALEPELVVCRSCRNT